MRLLHKQTKNAYSHSFFEPVQNIGVDFGVFTLVEYLVAQTGIELQGEVGNARLFEGLVGGGDALRAADGVLGGFSVSLGCSTA